MVANDVTGIGRHLRGLRKESGLSQAETAHRSGLSREAVCALENGRHDPRMSTIRRYCDAIGARMFIGMSRDG